MTVAIERLIPCEALSHSCEDYFATTRKRIVTGRYTRFQLRNSLSYPVSTNLPGHMSSIDAHHFHETGSSPRAAEQLFQMLLAVLVGRFQIIELLVQIGKFCLYIARFLRLSGLDFLGRGQDKPTDAAVITGNRDRWILRLVLNSHLSYSIIHRSVLRQGVDLA